MTYYSCQICGKKVPRYSDSKTEELGICSRCYAKAPVHPVECPICHGIRKVARRYAESKAFNRVCRVCVRIPYYKLGGYAADRGELTLPRHSIQVNGCTLIPAADGRCEHFTDCLHGSHANLNDVPRSEDCLFLVAKENWPGFTARECRPVLVPDAMRPAELMRELTVYY